MSEETYVEDPPELPATRSLFLDEPVAAGVRRNMQANKGRDTRPELALRSLLHAAGFRFRVNHPLPFDRRRRADITFTRVGLYVFLDGCFWHGCPEHYVPPKTRGGYWASKVEANRTRDADTDERIASYGGTALRIWEHTPAAEAAASVAAAYTLAIANPPARRDRRLRTSCILPAD